MLFHLPCGFRCSYHALSRNKYFLSHLARRRAKAMVRNLRFPGLLRSESRTQNRFKLILNETIGREAVLENKVSIKNQDSD